MPYALRCSLASWRAVHRDVIWGLLRDAELLGHTLEGQFSVAHVVRAVELSTVRVFRVLVVAVTVRDGNY